MLLRSTTRTEDGWTLSLARQGPVRRGPPVLLVPGFAANARIFSWHPSGPSWLEVLHAAGLDPWAVDLRGQGDARGSGRAGMTEQALVDLPAAIAHVLDATGAERLHLVGASLGGSLIYAMLAMRGDAGIDRVVTVGSPFSWNTAPPVVRAFAAWMRLGRMLQVRGSRAAARTLLPVARRVAPGALGIYLTPGEIDLSRPRELARTVEDPPRRQARQLAAWIRAGELKVGSQPVAPALSRVDRPLLVVTGQGDGIAPAAACAAVLDAWGGPAHHLHLDRDGRWAHADLFLGRGVQRHVLEPAARFLAEPEPLVQALAG